jgi:septum formation protein
VHGAKLRIPLYTFAEYFRNMILKNLKNKKLVLASKSPRRQQLLAGMDVEFEVRTKDVDESFPAALRGGEIPSYLAKVKAEAFRQELAPNEVLITADTVVWVEDQVLNKPENREEAISMLKLLSGNVHHVYTGVSVVSKDKSVVFVDETKVEFVLLNDEEIAHYIDKYKPYDKAGSYGVQEFIGYIGINRLEGSYFNVMGLPVHKLYEVLKDF